MKRLAELLRWTGNSDGELPFINVWGHSFKIQGIDTLEA